MKYEYQQWVIPRDRLSKELSCLGQQGWRVVIAERVPAAQQYEVLVERRIDEQGKRKSK
jgi:hypothetical protein